MVDEPGIERAPADSAELAARIARRLEEIAALRAEVAAARDAEETRVPARRIMWRAWMLCYCLALIVGTSAGFFSCRVVSRSNNMSREYSPP